MNDFETAVDQMLADSGGEGTFETYQSREADLEFLGESENYADFEGLDTDFDDDDELDDLDESEFEGDFETNLEAEGGFDSFSDFEIDEDDDEWSGEFEGGLYESSESSSMLSEAEVEELARDLVGVSSPEDMEAFFGKIFKGIKKVAGRAMRGGIGRKLMRAGSGLLGRALPIVGSSLGTALLPGIGTGLGGALGGQLRNLFSRRGRGRGRVRGRGRGRRSLGRSLTRQAVRSARRLGRQNPLASLIGSQGGNVLRSLFGFEAEATHGDPQLALAKRVVRTVADAADIAGRADNESDAAIAQAYRRAANKNLPAAVRAAMLSGPASS